MHIAIDKRRLTYNLCSRGICFWAKFQFYSLSLDFGGLGYYDMGVKCRNLYNIIQIMFVSYAEKASCGLTKGCKGVRMIEVGRHLP
jgi:hypothetical protein